MHVKTVPLPSSLPAHRILRDDRDASLARRDVIPVSAGAEAYPIIVHSHLEWDWVWQRPQQFLSRFSKWHPVLFVEGPKMDPHAEISRVSLRPVEDHPNVLVVQMWMPEHRWTDGEWMDAERHRLLQRVLTGPLSTVFADPVQWFYDPMAVAAFAGRMNERAIVYDCMDELSQFRGAPPELVRREAELLAQADVVFAGGPKMHRAKRKQNANCHCYGCGVDVTHFGLALDDATVVPADIADLPRPVLGYFGVVDERIDYELIGELADANVAGSVVIVGPTAKVNPADFPQRANLHWLGGRPYADLPAYVKGFDVCLMPFAINDATEFINPTKALEYMATGRPIVSSAIEDVVLQFSDVVSIADSRSEFVERALLAAECPDQDAVKRGRQIAGRNSWDAIVAQMRAHVGAALAAPAALASQAA